MYRVTQHAPETKRDIPERNQQLSGNSFCVVCMKLTIYSQILFFDFAQMLSKIRHVYHFFLSALSESSGQMILYYLEYWTNTQNDHNDYVLRE